MARARMKLRSNIALATAVTHKAMDAAVDKALKEGQDTAKQRMGASRFDYDPEKILRKDFGSGKGGMIFVPSEQWYYRYLEYGTRYITASPFLRPAHRKMRATFKREMGENFAKFIGARASLKRL